MLKKSYCNYSMCFMQTGSGIMLKEVHYFVINDGPTNSIAPVASVAPVVPVPLIVPVSSSSTGPAIAILLTPLNFTAPITQNPLNDITYTSDKGKDNVPPLPSNFNHEHFDDVMYEHFNNNMKIEEYPHVPFPPLEESSITPCMPYVLLTKAKTLPLDNCSAFGDTTPHHLLMYRGHHATSSSISLWQLYPGTITTGSSSIWVRVLQVRLRLGLPKVVENGSKQYTDEQLQTEIHLKETEARVHAKEACKLAMQIELRKLEVAAASALKDN
ncbi:hypothetical protein F5I97DRAFT_2074671 [Phlebopus sp. FC_14]|nr:hypothetical protein F5I97DRAFT_2074671 [Phlebopus sp. FC_14]